MEEILTKGRAPSPVLDMPQQLPLNYQQPPYMPNGNNVYPQPAYNDPSSYPTYSNGQTQPMSPKKNGLSDSSNYNFQRFYGPVSFII